MTVTVREMTDSIDFSLILAEAYDTVTAHCAGLADDRRMDNRPVHAATALHAIEKLGTGAWTGEYWTAHADSVTRYVEGINREARLGGLVLDLDAEAIGRVIALGQPDALEFFARYMEGNPHLCLGCKGMSFRYAGPAACQGCHDAAELEAMDPRERSLLEDPSGSEFYA